MPELSIEQIQQGLDKLPKELIDDIAARIFSNPNPTEWSAFPAQLHIDRKTRWHYIYLLKQCGPKDDILKGFLACIEAIGAKCPAGEDCNCISDLSSALPW